MKIEWHAYDTGRYVALVGKSVFEYHVDRSAIYVVFRGTSGRDYNHFVDTVYDMGEATSVALGYYVVWDLDRRYVGMHMHLFEGNRLCSTVHSGLSASGGGKSVWIVVLYDEYTEEVKSLELHTLAAAFKSAQNWAAGRGI